MLTKTQKGAVGELMLSACVMLASDGELELFRPVTDDDHTDITAGERGKVPALAIQVKTALTIDKQGYAVAKMEFPSGEPREHPAFLYAIAYVVDGILDAAWVVPSADFNRLAYRGRGRRGKGIELISSIRCPRFNRRACQARSCYCGADERRATSSQIPMTIAHSGIAGAEK